MRRLTGNVYRVASTDTEYNNILLCEASSTPRHLLPVRSVHKKKTHFFFQVYSHKLRPSSLVNFAETFARRLRSVVRLPVNQGTRGIQIVND